MKEKISEIDKHTKNLETILTTVSVVIITIVMLVIIKNVMTEDVENNYEVGKKEQLEEKVDSASLLEVENIRRKKEIFATDGQLYQLSVDQAMEKYPNDFNKQDEYQVKLEKIYRKQVEEKYELKAGELDLIILEGNEKRWTWKK